MSEEFINYSYIEMLIQDLEENSLGYWCTTQDEMAKSLRNLQQEIKQLKEVIDELREELSEIDDDIMKSCKNYDVNGIELKKILDKAKEKEH